MSAPLSAEEARAAFRKVQVEAERLALFSTESAVMPKMPTLGKRMRRSRAGEADPVSTVSLVMNEEQVLLWREAGALVPTPAVAMEEPAPAGELIDLYQYEKLEPNEINQFLTKLDGTLNDAAGLRKLRLVDAGGKMRVEYEGAPVFAGTKRRLLFVHGTFSKSLAFIEGIQKCDEGAAFLRRVFKHYDEVLVFEHPTLSVSPVLNAFDLFHLMAAARGPLDVIAHSRGGIVARWFLEGFAGAMAGNGPYRAVLVGSPLGGTSLASPRRLRDSLSLLSNVGAVLQAGGAVASAYVPLLIAPLALLKVATSVVSVAAKTPVIDAAISMIPGLSAQARIEQNHELERCFRFRLDKPPQYFTVSANFETENPRWKFWEWFRGDNLKDLATNQVFPRENDLVVDTASMTEFAGQVAAGAGEAGGSYKFGTTPTVHHTNYFEQPQTLRFIADSLAIPPR